MTLNDILPGRQLEPDDALKFVSALRRKYHQGPPEGHVIPQSQIPKYLDRSRKHGSDKNRLPDDIREFRISNYGEPLEDLNFAAGAIVMTWSVFPKTAVPTTLRIFSHPHFLTHNTLYLSWLTFGDYVAQSSSAELSAFFLSEKSASQIDNLYVFDEELRWCIGIHDEHYLFVVGDFNVFGVR